MCQSRTPCLAGIDTSPVNRVVYNTVSIGAAAISLHGPGSLEPIIEGSYSVILQSSSPDGFVRSALGQSGRRARRFAISNLRCARGLHANVFGPTDPRLGFGRFRWLLFLPMVVIFRVSRGALASCESKAAEH